MTVERGREWHIITCEYPPQVGGVADHSFLVAAELAAAGYAVHVWCPGITGSAPAEAGIQVHRDLGSAAGRDLRKIGRMLNSFESPRRVLVQWVPHGYGYRSLNLGFCLWLWRRAGLAGDEVEIMVHEPFLAFREGSWRQDMAAAVHRLMTFVLLRAARRVWVSTPAWTSAWKPYALGRRIPFAWLPVCSPVSRVDDEAPVQAIKNRLAPAHGAIIGHFGTYGAPIVRMLEPVLLGIAQRLPGAVLVLMGHGSEQLASRLASRHAVFADRLIGTGVLSRQDLSRYLQACELMVQPYPDGVSSRRTSVMAALSHGTPVVTTLGRLTEPLWSDGAPVVLVAAGDGEAMVDGVLRLAADAAERERLARSARAFYDRHFDLRHTIRTLTGPAA